MGSTGFIVFIIILAFLTIDKDSTEQEVVTPGVIITTGTQTHYSVESGVSENTYMRRAIFIEKIRNALPDIILPKNTEPDTPKETSQEVVEPSFEEQPKIIPPTSTSTKPELSTSTPVIDITESSSTTVSSSTEEQLSSS